MSTRAVVSLVAGSLAALLSAPALSAQKFITGFFMGTESGTPVELIAWAEANRSASFRMANDGSLDDAPVVPRTYRALLNLGPFEPIGVVATTREVFKTSIDRTEHRDVKFSVTRLGMTTYEVAVPDLEDWDKVQRLRKALKATSDNPMIFFFAVTNGVIIRYYPFFIERD